MSKEEGTRLREEVKISVEGRRDESRRVRDRPNLSDKGGEEGVKILPIIVSLTRFILGEKDPNHAYLLQSPELFPQEKRFQGERHISRVQSLISRGRFFPIGLAYWWSVVRLFTWLVGKLIGGRLFRLCGWVVVEDRDGAALGIILSDSERGGPGP